MQVPFLKSTTRIPMFVFIARFFPPSCASENVEITAVRAEARCATVNPYLEGLSAKAVLKKRHNKAHCSRHSSNL